MFMQDRVLVSARRLIFSRLVNLYCDLMISGMARNMNNLP